MEFEVLKYQLIEDIIGVNNPQILLKLKKLLSKELHSQMENENKINFKIEETGTEIQFKALTAREYAHLAEQSIPIVEDFTHSMMVVSRFAKNDFDFPELYAALKILFGESTTMYDDYKCSFGFPFHIIVTKNEGRFEYIVNFTDIKGGITFLFKKLLLTENEIEQYKTINLLREPIEKEFSETEMRYFTDWFMSFLRDTMLFHGKKFKYEFIRTNKSALFIYGYVNNDFFIAHYEEEEDYYAGEADFSEKNKNIKFNEVKEN